MTEVAEEKTYLKPTKKDILEAAIECVTGNREQDYGKAEDNFNTIADFWEAYIKKCCVGSDIDVCVRPEDVAAMMILLKVARVSSGHAKEDNWIDIAGYAACGGEIEGR